MRLGWARLANSTLLPTTGFNEAEARAPRMGLLISAKRKAREGLQ